MPRKKTGDEETSQAITQRKSANPRSGVTRASARVGSKSTASTSAPRYTDEQIRERAYYIFLEHRGTSGSPADDWCRAERELNGGA